MIDSESKSQRLRPSATVVNYEERNKMLYNLESYFTVSELQNRPLDSTLGHNIAVLRKNAKMYFKNYLMFQLKLSKLNEIEYSSFLSFSLMGRIFSTYEGLNKSSVSCFLSLLRPLKYFRRTIASENKIQIKWFLRELMRFKKIRMILLRYVLFFKTTMR